AVVADAGQSVRPVGAGCRRQGEGAARPRPRMRTRSGAAGPVRARQSCPYHVGSQGMKVARVQTRQVTVKLDKPIGSALGEIRSFGCVLVFVHDDGGGVGENLVFTLNDRRTGVLRQMVDELADVLVGHDAGHIAAFWARAWKDTNFLGQKGLPVMGISALDGALWDLLGKTAGLPLYRLLGGARQRVPAYHSGGLWLSRTEKELVEEAEAFVGAGFKAVKMRLGSADPAVDVARVRAVRKAIGPGIRLMADANQGLSESQAT